MGTPALRGARDPRPKDGDNLSPDHDRTAGQPRGPEAIPVSGRRLSYVSAVKLLFDKNQYGHNI